MRKIRQNIFETNSSSTHSISISNNKIEIPRVGKEVVIGGGEFGWEVETYTDWETKASYLATYLFQQRCNLEYVKEKDGEKEFNKLLKIWENDRESLYVVLEEVLDTKVVIPILNRKKYSDRYDMGIDAYIDHQSYDVAAEAFKDENTIKQFVFCPNSVLTTSNDNM